MRIAMCIADKYEETSTHASQLCKKHYARHEKQCAKIKKEQEKTVGRINDAHT